MVEFLYNFFKGYVKINVQGDRVERFLNMAVNMGIYVWEVERISDSELTMCISAKAFLRLSKIARETRTKVRILRKKGLYTYTGKLKGRKFFLVGFCALFMLTLFLSSLILDIKIIGNETVSKEVILQKLSEIDLKKFKFRSNIDNEKISVKLINDIDNILWVGVYEEGCRLTLEIKERTLPPKLIPMDIPCHIIAKKDAIIHKMNIENGEKTVNLNDVVVKGQLLVSGIINTQYDGQRYVHSMGEIIGRTWTEKSLDVKLYEYIKTLTGNKTSRHYLKIFGKTIDLSYGQIVPFYNSDKTVSRKVFGFIEYIKETYEEYTLKKQPLNEEVSLERGKKELKDALFKEYKEDKILKITYSVTATDSETRKITMLAETVEEIGEQSAIERNIL